MVAHVIDIVVRYRHEWKIWNPRCRTYDVRERRVAFGAGHEQKAFQPFGSRSPEPRHADFHVVTYEIENDGAMNAARVHLVFVEPDTPHSIGQEPRRLFRVEQREEKISLQLSRRYPVRDRKCDGDRCGIVVGTRRGDHAVVMRAQQERRKQPVTPRDDAEKVVPVHAVGMIGRMETELPVGLKIQLRDTVEQVFTDARVAGRTDHTAPL